MAALCEPTLNRVGEKPGQTYIPTLVLGARHGPVSTPDPAPHEGDPHRLVGAVIGGRYRVTRGISRGLTGHVYEAVQTPLGRRVALKILSVDRRSALDPRIEKRFHREASTAAQLAHPNIVTVFDYGEIPDGPLYMVMEYLEGLSLDQVVREQGPLPSRRAVGIAIQIARALRKAHQRGVIHRDLKPSNIMLLSARDEPDFVKILDFGLVKLLARGFITGPRVSPERLTSAGAMLGTPGYMSPEQAMAEPVDGRTDIYACGVILFEMLAGRPPFHADALGELLSRQVAGPVPAVTDVHPGADVGRELESVIHACLHRDRAHRPPTADALLDRLKAIWRFETDESYGTEVSLSSPLAATRVRAAGQEAMSQARDRGREPSPGPDNDRSLLRAARIAFLVGLCLLVSAVLGAYMKGSTEPALPDAPASELRPPPTRSPPEPSGYKTNPY